MLHFGVGMLYHESMNMNSFIAVTVQLVKRDNGTDPGLETQLK